MLLGTCFLEPCKHMKPFPFSRSSSINSGTNLCFWRAFVASFVQHFLEPVPAIPVFPVPTVFQGCDEPYSRLLEPRYGRTCAQRPLLFHLISRGRFPATTGSKENEPPFSRGSTARFTCSLSKEATTTEAKQNNKQTKSSVLLSKQTTAFPNEFDPIGSTSLAGAGAGAAGAAGGPETQRLAAGGAAQRPGARAFARPRPRSKTGAGELHSKQRNPKPES